MEDEDYQKITEADVGLLTDEEQARKDALGARRSSKMDMGARLKGRFKRIQVGYKSQVNSKKSVKRDIQKASRKANRGK